MPHAKSPSAQEDLFAYIMEGIAHEKKKIRRRHMMLYGGISTVSLAGTILLCVRVYKQAGTGLFYQNLHLLITDGPLVAQYWKEYMYALAETVPALQFAGICATALAFLWSLKIIITSLYATPTRYPRHAEAQHL